MDAKQRRDHHFIVRIWQEPGASDAPAEAMWRGSCYSHRRFHPDGAIAPQRAKGSGKWAAEIMVSLDDRRQSIVGVQAIFVQPDVFCVR